MIRIDGTAARSALLRAKAEHAVSARVRTLWQEAYKANEALRAECARIQREGCGCGC